MNLSFVISASVEAGSPPNCAVQVAPPSLVLMMVPPFPEAHPTSAVTKNTSLRSRSSVKLTGSQIPLNWGRVGAVGWPTAGLDPRMTHPAAKPNRNQRRAPLQRSNPIGPSQVVWQPAGVRARTGVYLCRRWRRGVTGGGGRSRRGGRRGPNRRDDGWVRRWPRPTVVGPRGGRRRERHRDSARRRTRS